MMGIDFDIIKKVMKLLAAFDEMKDVIDEVVDPSEKTKLKEAWKKFVAALKEIF
jgi:hypothetical protein